MINKWYGVGDKVMSNKRGGGGLINYKKKNGDAYGQKLTNMDKFTVKL